MISLLMLLLALAAPSENPIAAARESFRQVATYRVTLRSQADGSSQVIRYYFKKPGFVRMEFIKPHNGAVLVYNPEKKEARLRPFDYFKSLVLTLSLDNGLITSPRGHRVDESDPGTLLEMVKKLADRGKIRIMGHDKVGEKDAELVEVRGEGSVTIDGGIHRYLLWLDQKTQLPLRTKSFDTGDKPLEDVVMDDPEINIDIPDSFFDL